MAFFSGGINVKPKINTANPVNTITPPNQSNLSSLNFGVMGSLIQHIIKEKVPINKLIKKHHDQPQYCVKMPPKTGPNAFAPAKAKEFIAIDLGTSSYVTKIPHKDIVFDIRNAAKIP